MKKFNVDKVLRDGARRLWLIGFYIMAYKFVSSLVIGNKPESSPLKYDDGRDVLYNANDPTENGLAQLFRGATGSGSTLARKDSYEKMFNLVSKRPTSSAISLALTLYGFLYKNEASTLNREALNNYIYAVSQLEPLPEPAEQ